MRLIRFATLSLLIITTPIMAEDNPEDAEESPPTITYYEIKPSLIANLVSGGKYVRTDIQLMTNDETYKEDLELHGPAIRHTLLLLLSEQDGKTIKTAAGKEALRKEALTAVSSLMNDLSGKDSLTALFFTTFLVQ